MPLVSLPAELRGVVPRTGAEVAAALVVPDAAFLMRLVGPPKLRAAIAAIRDDEVVFDLVLSTLPGYAREFALRVSADEPSIAISRPRDANSGHHDLSFEVRGLLRDGDYLELIDVATEAVVYSMSATWMNLMEPLRLRLRDMEARQEKSERYLTQMRARLEATANVSRDRQLLERLDLYYYLVNDRLDRELRWLEERVSPAGPASLPAREQAAPTTKILARSVEGVGVHNLESNGVAEWRWFGPKVMLVLRDVGENLGGLTLYFSAVGEGVSLGGATVTANGLRLDCDAGAAADQRAELIMAVPPGLVRRDRSLLVHLQFAEAFSPPGDSRSLSAAFVEAELFYT